MSHVLMDDMGHYFYQTLDGQPQQVVVVTEDPDHDAIKDMQEHTIQDTTAQQYTTADTSSATTVITDVTDATANTTTGIVKLSPGLDNRQAIISIKNTMELPGGDSPSNDEALRSFAGAIAMEDGLLQVLATLATVPLGSFTILTFALEQLQIFTNLWGNCQYGYLASEIIWNYFN